VEVRPEWIKSDSTVTKPTSISSGSAPKVAKNPNNLFEPEFEVDEKEIIATWRGENCVAIRKPLFSRFNQVSEYEQTKIFF
jgi:hypothetical protein